MEQLFEFIGNHPILVGAFVLVFALFVRNEVARGGRSVTPQELVNMVNNDKAVVIDVRDPAEYSQGHIVDAIKDGTIQLVVNTTEGAQERVASYRLRRAALEHQVPYFTTLSGSRAMIRGVEALKGGGLDVAPLQSYSQANRTVGGERR
jgi:rhodanese-related sulfurtransferase